MSHVIIRGANGRRHEVDFGDDGITVSLHASAETVELAIDADEYGANPQKRRFASGKPGAVHFGGRKQSEVRPG